jgi:hypothetical protein
LDGAALLDDQPRSFFTAYRLFVKFATLALVLLTVAVVVIALAARYFDTETVIVMAIALGLVIFFGSMPVLLGALAKRKQDGGSHEVTKKSPSHGVEESER